MLPGGSCPGHWHKADTQWPAPGSAAPLPILRLCGCYYHFEILKSESMQGCLPRDFEERHKTENQFLANGKMRIIKITTVTTTDTDY